MYKKYSGCIMVLMVACIYGSLLGESRIGDFAPLAVGTTWEYSYNDTTFGTPYIWYLHITIKISSHIYSGNDSLALLEVKQSGRHIQVVIRDSISESFIDTVFFKGDSVWKGSSYRCKIFPFYHNHTADSSGTALGMIGNTPTRYLTTVRLDSSMAVTVDRLKESVLFVQNKGLYYYEYDFSSTRKTSSGKRIHVTLISFNNTNFKVPIANSRPAALRVVSNQTPQRLIITSQAPSITAGRVYNINGRTLRKTFGISDGVYVRLK